MLNDQWNDQFLALKLGQDNNNNCSKTNNIQFFGVLFLSFLFVLYCTSHSHGLQFVDDVEIYGNIYCIDYEFKGFMK